jgi:osmotically inducible protein OsmC
MPTRTASARWQGTLTEGSARSAPARAVTGNYSFKSRFEEGEGTNPEELIGAAHAGCFSMALSKVLADAGFPPTAIDTTATVHLERGDGGFSISRIHLDTTATCPASTTPCSRSPPGIQGQLPGVPGTGRDRDHADRPAGLTIGHLDRHNGARAGRDEP